MNETTYPIYRKYKNNREFHKINGPGQMISVLLMGTRGSRIQTVTDNHSLTHDAQDPALSVESNLPEFNKAYHEAMWYLAKANSVV